MQYYEFIACRNDTGASLPFAKVTVYLSGTATLASLFDSTGAGLSNPVTSTTTGEVGFAAANGAYDIRIASADGTYLSPMIQKVQFYDLANLDSAIASLKQLTVSASQYQIKYDGAGVATPSAQTITFTATKRNTTATVTWTIADLSGNPITPASTYLSAATGDSATMTRPNFDLARGTSSGLIITGTATDGITMTGSASVVAVHDGAAGTNGTTGNHLAGYGLPANNLGANGDDYTDLSTGVIYGQKTGGTWPLGTIADVNAGWSHYDFSTGATFPTSLVPWLRASPSTAIMTNLCYHDAPAASYSTFGQNVPITRVDLGVAVFQTSRNVFLNSTAPVTQNCTVVVGTIIVWSNHDAPVTITTAAGTATGSGFGAIVLGTPQILTITGAGTISVTKSGSGTWYACQVEYDPVLPGNSVATPLIITGGSAVTRDADSNSGAGALLTAFQGSTGTFIMEVSRVETQTGYIRTPGVLSVNNATYSYVNGTTFAHRGGNVATALGNQTWATDQKWGFAWGGGAQVFGAGDGIPTADATAFPYATLTSVRFGAQSTATDGQQNLCGWIKRIKWRADQQTNRALFDQYTATVIPTYANSASRLFRQSLPGNALPNTKTGVAAVRANTRDSIFLFEGTSHSAGVDPSGSQSASSFPAKVAARLLSQYGIQARYAGWFGNNNAPPSTGASAYRPERLTFSAGWSGYGTQLGGASMKTSTSGAVITDAPPGTTDTYTFYYWTFPGYGGWTLSDGTHSKTVAAETAYTASISGTTMTVTAIASGFLQAGDVLTNGPTVGTTIVSQLTGMAGSTGTYQVSTSQTFASAMVKSIGLRAVTLAPADGVVRGTNTFTMTSNDALPKTACGGLERDSVVKSVLCINGGTTLRTAVILALDSSNSGAAENSVQAVVRMLAPDFTHYEAVTNDAGAVTGESLYTSSVQYALAQALAFGDVMVSGDPPTAPGAISQSLQDRYTWLLYKAAYSYGVTINAMPDVLGPRLKWANMGFYKSDGTHFSASGVLTGNGDIFGNIVADFIAANV
jgi:hypothetical protein